MLVLNLRDSIKIGNNNCEIHSPNMEMHTSIKADDEGVMITCWHLRCEKPEAVLKIGDMVHINIKQYTKNCITVHDYPESMDALCSILKQYEIVDMKSEHTEGYVNYHYVIIFKERDRQIQENDGYYWIMFNDMPLPFSKCSDRYFTRLGKEYPSEEDIKIAKESAIKKGFKYHNSVPLNLDIAPSSYVQYCWEYYIEHMYYNNTYGKAVSKTTMAFPDADKEIDMKSEADFGSVLLAILWGAIPEGHLGFTYLLLALFTSACVCIMYNGWFMIICFMIIYWCKNTQLKINKRG